MHAAAAGALMDGPGITRRPGVPTTTQVTLNPMHMREPAPAPSLTLGVAVHALPHPLLSTPCSACHSPLGAVSKGRRTTPQCERVLDLGRMSLFPARVRPGVGKGLDEEGH
jgi:hypothetical protein